MPKSECMLTLKFGDNFFDSSSPEWEALIQLLEPHRRLGLHKKCHLIRFRLGQLGVMGYHIGIYCMGLNKKFEPPESTWFEEGYFLLANEEHTIWSLATVTLGPIIQQPKRMQVVLQRRTK